MKKTNVVVGLLLVVSLVAVGAQAVGEQGVITAPQFDVMPRVPYVGEASTSFTSRFSGGYEIYWSVNNTPVGKGKRIYYTFPSLETYLVTMRIFQGPNLIYLEEQLVTTQNMPPGYTLPEDPYVPPHVSPEIDMEGDLSLSLIGAIFMIIGALLLLLEQ